MTAGLNTNDLGISIHAPLRGRLFRPVRKQDRLKFQSTPPCGGDQDSVVETPEIRISIHAPLRGRPFKPDANSACNNFNPRPLAGATAVHVRGGKSPGFQSTPPCGGDGCKSRERFYRKHFNPRPLAGATPMLGYAAAGAPLISIHAPLRGRRPNLIHRFVFVQISIHAPLRGRPGEFYQCFEASQISIHAPLRGRPLPVVLAALPADFNPRPLAGATDLFHQLPAVHQFQSTPPCGGDFSGREP